MKQVVIAYLIVISLLAGCSAQAPKQTSKSESKSNSEAKESAKSASKQASKPAGHPDFTKPSGDATGTSDATGTASKVKKKEPVWSGLVFEVDSKAKTVQVRKEGTDLGMVFDVSKTKLEGYKDIKDIKSGDKISIRYKVELGTVYAVNLIKE